MNDTSKNNSAYAPYYNSYDDEAIEPPILLQYWHAALRHKIMIFAIIIMSIVAGFIATLLTTPYYTSTSRVEINREQDKITNVEGVEASDSASQSLEFYQTQYALLEARSLAERVVRAKNLSARDDFFELFNVNPDDNGIITQNNGAPNSAQLQARQKLAVQILQDNISIQPVRGSSLIDINFSSPSAVLSREITDGWVEQFIASNLDRRFRSTADARVFLEEQLANLREKLEDSERNLTGYADANEIITLSEQTSETGKILSQRTLSSANLEALNKALADAKTQRITAESSVKANIGAQNATASTVLNNLLEERAKIQAEYSRLLVQFEPEYPVAQSIASQIESLNSSIKSEENRLRSSSIDNYREALDRENQLKIEVEKLKSQFIDERRDAIQYDIFRREVDTNRQLYDSLLQRYKEIGVAGVATNNISVIDKAQISDKPSSPILILNILLSILAGFGLAAAYVFVIEQIDQTVKETSDLKLKLGISSLGSIPDIDKVDILESLKDRKSVAWEAYLSIRTSLLFLTEHGIPKSFLLTSSRPNEGKSTTAIALAAVLANKKRKTLIVDADMRNPSLHKMTGFENINGLSNYLAGQDNLNEAIIYNEDYNFDILSAGPIPPNAAELLGGERMQILMKTLQDNYDVVILDAPPVLGLADIPILANCVEGVIYTIEAGGVKLRDIQSALQRIKSTKALIFGGIVTKIPQNSSGYGYAYQYNYGDNKK